MTWLTIHNVYCRPPLVIMGHGMGVQKDMGLHPYADGFASAGIAVLAFDYRTFGGSTGTPRNWVSPRRHVQDWKSVVQHVLVSTSHLVTPGDARW
jgi:alpha-beta hydrolase superfamily lysophospholipase